MKDLGHGVLQIEPGETVELGTYTGHSGGMSKDEPVCSASASECPNRWCSRGWCSLSCFWLPVYLSHVSVPVSPTSPRTGPKGSQDRGRGVRSPEQGRGGGGGRPPGRDDYIVRG